MKEVRLLEIRQSAGDDKPLKYPLMFSVRAVVLINKMDVLPCFDIDLLGAGSVLSGRKR